MTDGSKSIVDQSRTEHFVRTKVEKDGKTIRTFDIGDDVAAMLRGKTGDELYEVCKQYGLQERYDAKWRHLNAGQKRMAVGNALRKLARDQAAKAAADTKAA